MELSPAICKLLFVLLQLLKPSCSVFLALTISSCTVPDWRDVTVSPLENIRDSRIYNPVLEASDVTDVENADFVADPFLFKEGDSWYMFFEVGK